MKVKSESEVAQSCPTLRDPMDYSLPGSSIHGIFQARVLEWGAIMLGGPYRHVWPRKRTDADKDSGRASGPGLQETTQGKRITPRATLFRGEGC